jgi:flagellar biosynthesis chaperone FliJ
MNMRKDATNGVDKVQLRGDELRKKISDVIRDMAEIYQQKNIEYVYNASELSRKIGTTRKTLRNHQAFIDVLIEELKVRRRMADGNGTVEALKSQIGLLRNQLIEKDKQLLSLRNHHVEIFKRFHDISLDTEYLIRPVIEKECIELGHCIFCGTEVEKAAMIKRSSNVINFPDQKN